LVDPTAHDALFCSVDMRRTGAATDSYNKAKDIGRAEQDEYAAMSHDRAATAAKNALLDDEIVAAEVPQRRGDPLQVSQDDGVRPATSAESLGKLRPAFARTARSPPGRPAGPQNWPSAL
jgi:acetyl-CoA C-acetyltransferase